VNESECACLRETKKKLKNVTSTISCARKS